MKKASKDARQRLGPLYSEVDSPLYPATPTSLPSAVLSKKRFFRLRMLTVCLLASVLSLLTIYQCTLPVARFPSNTGNEPDRGPSHRRPGSDAVDDMPLWEDAEKLAQSPAATPEDLDAPINSARPVHPLPADPPIPAEEVFDSSINASLPLGCKRFLQAAAHPDPTRLIGSTNASAPASSLVQSTIPKLIHFLHYNDNLHTPRYLCSLESAARHNPEHTIRLHAKNAPALTEAIRAWRERANLTTRLEIIELDWWSQYQGTPLEPWYRSGAHMNSSWVYQNMGNAFRMGLLWREGGVYLDLDIVSLNAISGIGRSLGMQDPTWFNNAFMSFPKADVFVWRLMQEFVDGFKGYIWARNGPRMVSRTYWNLCQPQKDAVGVQPPPAAECQGLGVAPPERFYPFQYENRTLLFQDWGTRCETMEALSNRSIGVHWWHRKVDVEEKEKDKTTGKKKDNGVEFTEDALLVRLMQAHCPAIFEVYSKEELVLSEKNAVKEEELGLAEKNAVKEAEAGGVNKEKAAKVEEKDRPAKIEMVDEAKKNQTA
ncbi:Lactosylceramide 4-alpha-galactosyltransferase [Irineochytrium annulatum]|nr:Lactosylceramide 4-alpha-galactosyltransferase [Irineochytrium annulatum]